MVSDHALKLEVRAQLQRHNALAAQHGAEPLSYTQVRSWVLDHMIVGLDDLTPLRQDQVAAGIHALDSGRDLIICGSVFSEKTALAQAVSNRVQGGVYIAPDRLEFGKELRGSRNLAWALERADQAKEARSLTIDEIRGGEDPELRAIAESKQLAVVVHANYPFEAQRRIENLGFERRWNDPTILFCSFEDRLNDEELRERRARAQDRLNSIQAIVNP